MFGVPHALFGGGLLTDPRLWFGVVFVLGFAGTLALSGVRRPWLWTAVVTASPIIAFPLTTGGDDLPVLALICVGLALLRTGQTPRPVLRIILAGLVLGLAAAMKATAWPALAVALALVAARDGKRAAGWLALATIAVPIAADGPVLITQPAAVVSNTILFPLGLTKIKSPAASFLPGHLIAEAWGPGHLVAIGLVLLAGLGVAASLVLRPPRDERAAGWRLLTGLVLMFAFAPASRFGYAVYPLGLACWLLLAAPAASGLISAYEAAPCGPRQTNGTGLNGTGPTGAGPAGAGPAGARWLTGGLPQLGCAPGPRRCRRASASAAPRDFRRGSTRGDLSLERGELLVHLGGGPGLVELLLDVVGVSPDVFEHPGRSSSSTAPARACIVAILSWARWSAAPESPKVLEIPAALSSTALTAFAAVYWAFSTSFWVRNSFTRFCRASRVCSSFSSCSVSCWCCGSMASICAWAAALRDSASLARSSLPWESAALAWSWRWSTECWSCCSCNSICLRDAAMSTSPAGPA